MQNIDLRSDTVTKPSEAMLQAMLAAPVGDDVFNEDPTAVLLQKRIAQLFVKEDALFMPSGTMSNQIAIKCNTQPLDEIILEKNAHILNYEGGAYAFHSGVSTCVIDGINDKLHANDIESSIKPNYDWLPKTTMVSIENTINKAGGVCYSLHEMEKIYSVCKQNNLKLHIDGARIFNAIVKNNYSSTDVGKCCDTISICFSKGLGAPIGSVLVGDNKTINTARRYRKVFGGGMRQIGYLAAACNFALDHNIVRLIEDHNKATTIAETLRKSEYVKNIKPVETNIIIFEMINDSIAQKFIQHLAENNIFIIDMGKGLLRIVTHLDIKEDMIDKILFTIKSFVV